MKERRSFHKGLVEAARQARNEGTITSGQVLLIRSLIFRPNAMEKVYATVLAEAMDSKQFTTMCTASMDKLLADDALAAWDMQQILDLLKEWLPVILQIIAMFL